MRTIHPSPSAGMHNSRNFVSGLVLFGFLALIAGVAFAPSRADDSYGKWAAHPALQAFDLSTAQLPSKLYLVRTRGSLPSTEGIVIHGVRDGVFVVSGDPAVVTGLAHRGCAVIPLRKPRVTESPTSSVAPRTWTRVMTPDPDIAAMVTQVNWSAVSTKIQWLVDMGTRYSYASNHSTVANDIADVFDSYGLQSVLHSFVYAGSTMYNVEATQIGTIYPDSFYIICGHFDSVSEKPRVSAPGADDNGTGTAAVLTAAEILTQYQFEYSIRYICFGGEEQGLVGSQVYASWAKQQNLGILGVLNFDMMGYWEPGVEEDLEIETNVASQWLAAAIVNAANLYTSAAYELHVDDNAWWGDHASFWDEGYAAVNHEESWDWGDPDFNPYYHTSSDLITYIGEDFTVGNIKVGVAALATLANHVPGGVGVDDPTATPKFAGSLLAHPNPFNNHVTFTVAGLPDRDNVRILIYDALGRRAAIVPISLSEGRGSMYWDVTQGVSQKIGTGVYFAKMEGAPGVAPVKLVHIK
jgi:hypothetical protein